MTEDQPERMTIDDLEFLSLTEVLTSTYEIIDILDGEGRRGDGYYSDQAILARRVPGELIEELTSAENARAGAEIRLAKGDDPRTLEFLAFNSEFADTLNAVARNPHCGVEALMHLATFESLWISAGAGSNPSLPVWAMDVVYDTGHPHARHGLVRHPQAQPHLIDRASRSPDPRLRASAAGSTRAAMPALSRLARDPDATVRRTVAFNPSAPVHLLDQLAFDPVEDVRIWLVRNPAIPGFVFDAVVDRALREGGEVPGWAVTAPGITLRSAWALQEAGFGGELARNQACPGPVLEYLYGLGYAILRGDVVSNDSCPRDLRRRAATQDESPDVRKRAADALPPDEDPRTFATPDTLRPGMTVEIRAGISPSDHYLLRITEVGDFALRESRFVADLEPFLVVELTGQRLRVNGEPHRRYPGLYTCRLPLCSIEIIGDEA